MTKGEDYWNQIFSFKKASNPLFNEFISETELLFLKEQLPRLRKGKALDLGFGNGRNSLFLARNQFQVIAIDNSEVAVNSLKNKAQSLSMSIETQKADIELHILGLLQYDTIIMTYYKPPVSRVFDEIIRSLKHGGTLLIESFLNDEINEILGPEENYKNIFFKPNEVLKNLGSLRLLYYNEGLIDGKQRVQCLAQKPLDKDIEKYNLFNMSQSKESPKNAQMNLAEALFKKKEN